MIIEELDYIEHAGVKGMRWGVRKEEDSSGGGKSRKERKTEKYGIKADKFKAKADEHQKNIENLSEKYHNTSSNRQKKKIRENLREERIAKNRALEDEQRKRAGKLSTGQKKVAVGASVAAALLVTYGTYKMANSGQLSSAILRGKAHMEGRQGLFKRAEHLANKDLDVDGIRDQVVKGINPNYGRPGSKLNCRRCTFAYEMRRRGYDVAATRTTNGAGQNVSGLVNATTPGKKNLPSSMPGLVFKQAMESRTPGNQPARDMLNAGKFLGFNKLDDISSTGFSKAMKTMPDGARGELGVKWTMGGGHSVAWEIVKGKPVIFDTQSGKVFKSGSKELKELFDTVSEAEYTRLDNVAFDKNFLSRWLRDAD